MSVARQSLLNDINTSYPSFRGKPLKIAMTERIGYTCDINTANAELLPTLTREDLESFYRQHIKGQPYQLMIVGNIKTLDMKELSRYGTIVRLKKDDIYKTK